MKLKKHLSKMIKRWGPFFRQVWRLLFQTGFLPLLRKLKFLSKSSHFFNQLILNVLTHLFNSKLIWLMFKTWFRMKPKIFFLEFEKYSNGQNWEIKLILYFIFYCLKHCYIKVYVLFDYWSFCLFYCFTVTFLFPFSSSYLLTSCPEKAAFSFTGTSKGRLLA